VIAINYISVLRVKKVIEINMKKMPTIVNPTHAISCCNIIYFSITIFAKLNKLELFHTINY